MKHFLAVAAAMFALSALAAPPEDTAAGEQRFRALYKELVETNTTLSAGSCTLAAERMASRLKAAGFPDGDLHLFAAPDHPKEGGLVAVYPGRDPTRKAILLHNKGGKLAQHADAFGRDSDLPSDLLAVAALYLESDERPGGHLDRYADPLSRENYKPKRTLKVALTCGEKRRARSMEPNGSRRIAANSSMRHLRSTRERPENSMPRGAAYPSTSRRAKNFRRTTASK
jgi:hypothetical protein